MITSFVIMLREGIEAALVVGIVIAYLAKIGRGELNRVVYAALGSAVLASLVLAGVLQRVGLDPEDPLVEGIVLGVAGIFVATMVLWMWRAARGLKAGMESRLACITTSQRGAKLALGLFGFIFVMVLREGIEAVLFLQAAALGQKANLASFIGGVFGMALAALFAGLFIRGSVRIDLRRFFRYTSLALLVLAAKLLLVSLHEFAELGLLPLANAAFEEAGELVEGTAGAILTGAIIAVPLLLVLWESSAGLRRREGAPVDPVVSRKVDRAA